MEAPVSSWTSTCEEICRPSEAGFLVPPDDVIDALAWYAPTHCYGLGSAIYIREAAVFDVAAAILNRLETISKKMRLMSPRLYERRRSMARLTRGFRPITAQLGRQPTIH